MYTSLYAPEVQTALNNAVATAGQAGGPFPSPGDWRDQIIYFLMVDRFNNPAAPPVHQPYDDPNYYQYQGGKFAGVREQLAYIKSLGAGALWLSPVLKNLRRYLSPILVMRPSRSLPRTRPMRTTNCARWSMPPTRPGCT